MGPWRRNRSACSVHPEIIDTLNVFHGPARGVEASPVVNLQVTYVTRVLFASTEVTRRRYSNEGQFRRIILLTRRYVAFSELCRRTSFCPRRNNSRGTDGSLPQLVHDSIHGLHVA